MSKKSNRRSEVEMLKDSWQNQKHPVSAVAAISTDQQLALLLQKSAQQDEEIDNYKLILFFHFQ